MLGTKTRQFRALPPLTLDELVRGDYAEIGRLSVDPVVFFKLQLVMFLAGIRSERQLLRMAVDRLSVRWYLGYNLDEPLPDHSSPPRIRTCCDLEAFRHFFEAIVEQCQEAGLVWGEELYFDATHVLADAALDSLTARFTVDARAAIQPHVDALFPTERTLSRGEQEEGSGEVSTRSEGQRAFEMLKHAYRAI